MICRSKRNIQAVTLFEMLLVLFLSSMIMMAAFKYEQTEKEKDVANALAEHMFIFSQTVRTYAVNHRDAMQDGTFSPTPAITAPSSYRVTGSGPNQTYVFTGVTWLTNPALTLPNTTTPYLPSDFSFNGLSPLELRREDLVGDQAIQVTISGNDITIIYGDLYDARDSTKPPQVRGALSAIAAREAATQSDPMLGPSVFSYKGGVDASGTPQPITATLIASTSLQTQLANPTVSGALDLGGSTTSATTDGTIKNVEAIQFDQSAGVTTSITGLNQMTFSAQGAPGEIQNLSALDFQNGNNTTSIIRNLNTLIFDQSTTASNTISNVTNLNFQDTGGNLSNVNQIQFSDGGKIKNIDTINLSGKNASISGLKSITFNSGDTFSGIDKPVAFVEYFNESNHSASGNIFKILSGIKSSDYICTLSLYRFNDGDAGHDKACSVVLWVTNEYALVGQNVQACGAMCYKFTP